MDTEEVANTAEPPQAMEVDSLDPGPTATEPFDVSNTGSGTSGNSAAGAHCPGDPPVVCDSSSESDSDADAGTEKGATPGKSPEDKLVKAVSYKDKGNACIAAGDSAGALKRYERGIKIVSSLSNDEQVKTLMLSLRLNLALACTKEGRFRDAETAATKVLDVDSLNVKALFRRGVARARLGALDSAKADLVTVVKADPRNGGAKKELKVVRDQLLEHRQKEKASYGGLFEKGPMYNDKEVERQKREAEVASRRKQEEEEWAKSNEKRKAEGKEELSLEDWREEKKEAEEKTKQEKERKEREKEASRPSRPSRPLGTKPGKVSSSGDGESDDAELDEEDLKIIQDTKKQGYCYFKRTLSEKEQSLLNAEQDKLRARVSPTPSTSKDLDNGGASDATRSVWNEAGTWEEVQKTEWCKAKLVEILSTVSVTTGTDVNKDPAAIMKTLGDMDFSSIASDGNSRGLEAVSSLKTSLAKLTANVTQTEVTGGDAHIICVSNKRKHIFDFNVKIDFSLTIDESMGLPPTQKPDGQQETVRSYKGSLTFPDMTNSDVDNGRFDSEPELKWSDKKSRWDKCYNEKIAGCIGELKSGILSGLGTFFAQYKKA